MELLKRYPILFLVLANALALSFLVLPVNAVGTSGGETTFCDPEAVGCTCWDGCNPEGVCWSPEGCYDDLFEGGCEANEECTEAH